MITLDRKLKKIFCDCFGKKYEKKINQKTSMDDIVEWDSLSFFELVLEIEKAYKLKFDDIELNQFFNLGHIQRIINLSNEELPLDDVANALLQIDEINNTPDNYFKLIILSGSSTREGMLTRTETEKILKKMLKSNKAKFFNISVSGLVLAETLQIIDNIKNLQNAYLFIGYSPIIFAGCGKKEFQRSINCERFNIISTNMDEILNKFRYFSNDHSKPKSSLASWMKRNKNKLLSLTYNQYLYPTLEPWSDNKMTDNDSIIRFYYNSIENFDESLRINEKILYRIIDLSQSKNINLTLISLPLHSYVKKFLNKFYKSSAKKSDLLLNKIVKKKKVPFKDLIKKANIKDSDFRDPAHIFRKKDKFTLEIINAAINSKNEK